MNTARCSTKKITLAALMASMVVGLVGCQPFDHYAANEAMLQQVDMPRQTSFAGQPSEPGQQWPGNQGPGEQIVQCSTGQYSTGQCDSAFIEEAASPFMEPPRELSMVSLPSYPIEPPDVLMIEMLKLVPKPPYRAEVYDVLRIHVLNTIPDQPINEFFLVENEGTINLGAGYGSVRVAGMTIDEITETITDHLFNTIQLRDPVVSVSLSRAAGIQEITQEYLVGPDGRINLRHYGTLHVAGMTISEATEALEKHLSQFFDSPEATINVIGYNSKTYYVITQGAGLGQPMVEVPVTGNDTVLDAISHIGGLSQMSSKKMWIARPAPGNLGQSQILPIDWDAITREGSTATNYQLLPEDRLYIAQDEMMALTNYIATVTAPFERIVGFATFSTSSIRGFQTTGRNYNKTRRQ